MRFIHLADLHLGRSLSEFNLIDLQQEVLSFVVDYAVKNRVDAVVIAGDVYDRGTPSVQAVNLLSAFLGALARLAVPVLIVSGNHDSPDRLSFLSGVLEQSGIHIAGDYRLGQPPVVLTDEYGPVNFFLMPFFRPGLIREQAPDESIACYDDAVRCAVRRMPLDRTRRNVLVTHQFVCGEGRIPLRSDSEMLFLGGTEMVHADSFRDFDYVALGHLHQAQKVGSATVRYAGAPLKYALGESGSAKSFTVVDLGEKGRVDIKAVPIVPSIDLRSLRGKLGELLDRPQDGRDGDFLDVLLTDEQPVYDAMQRLRARYPRVVNVRRERDMMQSLPAGDLSADRIIRRDPLAVFSRFCEEMTGYPPTDGEKSEIESALREAAREEENA